MGSFGMVRICPQVTVSREMYRRMVQLVNTMVRDTMRLCLHRNLQVVQLIFSLFHKKGMSPSALSLRDTLILEDIPVAATPQSLLAVGSL